MPKELNKEKIKYRVKNWSDYDKSLTNPRKHNFLVFRRLDKEMDIM